MSYRIIMSDIHNRALSDAVPDRLEPSRTNLQDSFLAYACHETLFRVDLVVLIVRLSTPSSRFEMQTLDPGSLLLLGQQAVSRSQVQRHARAKRPYPHLLSTNPPTRIPLRVPIHCQTIRPCYVFSSDSPPKRPCSRHMSTLRVMLC
jgi:hypothetical protein